MMFRIRLRVEIFLIWIVITVLVSKYLTQNVLWREVPSLIHVYVNFLQKNSKNQQVLVQCE